MLQLSVTFYLPPNADHAAIARTLAELSKLTGPGPAATTNVQVVNVEKPADVPAAVAAAASVDAPEGASVLAGPGSAEQPKRGRGRPRKDGTPTGSTAAVQGVPAEPSHAATPPPAAPVQQSVAKGTAAAAAADDAALADELFGDSKPAPTATLPQLQAAMQAFIKAKGASACKALFAAQGYNVLSEVPAEAYGSLVAALRV